MSKFKVGQKVYDLANGWTKVEEIKDDNTYVHTIVTTERRTFSVEGLFDVHCNKLPTLLTIEEAAKMNIFPPKKKVVKEVKVWVNVYENFQCSYFTKESAERNNEEQSNRIACVELKGSYEIEVDSE